MMRPGPYPAALFLSGLLHGGAILLLTFLPDRARAVSTDETHQASDVWSGETFDVEMLAEAHGLPLGPGVEPSPAPPARPPQAPPEPSPEPLPARATSVAPEPTPMPDEAGKAPGPKLRAPAPPKPIASLPPGPDTSPPASTNSAASVQAEESNQANASPAAGAAQGIPGFGAEGPALELRDLGRAFTRALPAAALPRDGWQRLRVGTTMTVEVTLHLDGEGRLGELELGSGASPTRLTRLLERARLLLRRGRFALQTAQPGAAAVTYEIKLVISDREVTADPFAEEAHIMRRGFEPPRREAPGRAYFTFASGKHVEISIEQRPPVQ